MERSTSRGREEGMDAGAALLWLASGLAIGAAVGLLFAPMPGEETRRKLADLAADKRNSIADHGRGLVSRGREFYARGRDLADEAAELFDRGRSLVDN